MREMRKPILGAIVLLAVLALTAPGTASAFDCSQCTSSNYCEEMCQWGFWGEYYFDICRNWTYPCVEYGAASSSPEPSFLLPAPAGEAPAASMQTVQAR